MKNEHITDNEIQQFLFPDSIIDQRIREHVESCNECKSRVDQFKLIFVSVSELKKPQFDFNLTDTIMEVIQGSKHKYSIGRILIAFSFAVIVSISGILAYFLKIDIVELVSGIAPISVYLILTALISILLFHCFDINRQYKKHMDLVNSF
jgi:hypothetical protein